MAAGTLPYSTRGGRGSRSFQGIRRLDWREERVGSLGTREGLTVRRLITFFPCLLALRDRDLDRDLDRTLDRALETRRVMPFALCTRPPCCSYAIT